MIKKISGMLFLFLLFSIYAKADVPKISAESAIVIDADSKNVIFEKNPDKKLPMASTTKIMTAICAIENSNTNMPVSADKTAVGTEGSSIYLKENEKISLKELLYALLLNSGNDAAMQIAISVSGSVEEFVSLMNKTAEKLKAPSTHFTNPSGLYEENHYTCARDLSYITSYALKNPLFKKIVSTYEMKISSPEKGEFRYLKNHNKLLRLYDGCIGVKTGFTKKCGRCLVSAAQRNGISLICVTLNAPNDWQDHKLMLDYGFEVSKAKNDILIKETSSSYIENDNNDFSQRKFLPEFKKLILSLFT